MWPLEWEVLRDCPWRGLCWHGLARCSPMFFFFLSSVGLPLVMLGASAPWAYQLNFGSVNTGKNPGDDNYGGNWPFC